MCSEFVPASELYHVESRTPIAHPAHQATDADVRRALEAEGDREVCTDGGTDSSGTQRSDVLCSECGTPLNGEWIRTDGRAHPDCATERYSRNTSADCEGER